MSRSVSVSLALLALAACKPKPYIPPDTSTGTDTDTETTDTDTDTVGDDDDDDNGPIFLAHVVDTPANPAYADVGDMDGDGQPEIVVSTLGELQGAEIPPGLVTIYTRGADLDTWSALDVVPAGAGVLFPGHPTLDDVDGDGDLDIIVPSGGRACEASPQVGPCGGLAWMENPGGAGSWSPHIVISGSVLYYTNVAVADIDGDGNDDWVTVGEQVNVDVQQSQLVYFRGLGGGSFDTNPQLVTSGAAPWPTLFDLDGDGDRDILIGGRYAPMPAFAWIEHAGGAAWVPHPIDATLARGYQIRPIPDLFGDGEIRLLATNHTNTNANSIEPDTVESVVATFDIPADPTTGWGPPSLISSGIESVIDSPLLPIEAPGTFDVGDADQDGDLDILVAGDGDPTVYLLDQTSPGTFQTRILRQKVGNTGGTRVVDLDGDGDVELLCVTQLGNAVFVIEYNGG